MRLDNGFAAPDYIRSYNGSVLSLGDKYIDNSDNFGGNRGQMPTHLVDLAQRFKPGASTNVLRFGTEFYTLLVTAGAGTNGAITLGGVTTYLAISGLRFPLPARYALSFWIRVTSGDCVVASQTLTLIDGIEISGDTALPSNSQWHHIEHALDYAPSQFVGYEPNPYRIYASPNSTFEIAAPALFPGLLRSAVDAPTGLVSALSAYI